MVVAITKYEEARAGLSTRALHELTRTDNNTEETTEMSMYYQNLKKKKKKASGVYHPDAGFLSPVSG